MADNDWRVTITLADEEHAGHALRSLREHRHEENRDQQVEDDIKQRLGRTVAAGAGENQIFLYAATEDTARQAEQAARDLLARRGLDATFTLNRWHPIEEKWEDPSAAVPATDEQRQAEQRRLDDEETAESLASGVAQYQVRIELPTHREAVALADRLKAEGLPVIRRWKFMVVGTNNEDEANDLASRLKQEVPTDATVQAEHAGALMPFIMFS